MSENINVPNAKEHETFTQEEYMVMKNDLLCPVEKIGKAGKIWIAFLLAVVFAGIVAYIIQETKSKYVTTSLRDYTMWGIYISNFLFMIAIGLVGVLMSAILKLTHFEWYRPLSRIAEVVSIGAIMFGGVSIVVAMGRPDRLLNLIIYGRIQSPIIWDVIGITTDLTACLILLFIPLIPSLATCKNHLVNLPKWQLKMYNILSFGWQGTPEQWKLLKRTMRILTAMVIPLGVIVCTITAWLFATTLRAEWDSTNFGAYFVSNAFLLSVAVMTIATFVFRKAYNLQKYLTEMHFDKLGQSMVLMALIHGYFNINEYLIPAYKMSGLHANHLLSLFVGKDAFFYWSIIIFGIIVPFLLPLFPKLRRPIPLTIISVIVLIAGWFRLYLIVIPGLLQPYLPIQDVPASWSHYFPSVVEMTVVAATIAGVLLVVTLFSKFFPIISVWEVAEGELDGKKEITNYK